MTSKSKAQGGSKGKSRDAGRVDLDAAAAEKYKRSARLVVSLYEPDRLPDWLTDLIMRGLEVATAQTGIGHWGDEDFDLRGLADLLAATDTPRFTLNFDPKKDLAELISAVLKHPDCPADLYHAMRAEIAKLTEPTAVNEDPAVLRVALEVHKTEQEGGAS